MEAYGSQGRLKYISGVLNGLEDVSSVTEGTGLVQFTRVPVCIILIGTQWTLDEAQSVKWMDQSVDIGQVSKSGKAI